MGTPPTDRPPFRALVRARKRFVLPALAAGPGLYLALALLAGCAPHVMARQAVGSVNVGYLLVAATYAVTWTIAVLYVRRANRTFDRLAREAGGPGEAGEAVA